MWCDCRSRQPARDASSRDPREVAAGDRLAVESSNARTEHRRSEQPWRSRVDEFRTAKLRRGSWTSVQDQGAARVIEDYYDFPTGSDF